MGTVDERERQHDDQQSAVFGDAVDGTDGTVFAGVDRRGRHGLGRITLNRPRALNALDHRMVRGITAVLTAWTDAPEVRVVVLQGAGERGLCAGGDMRALHGAVAGGNADDLAQARSFFRDEYRLNALIARYAKPVLALMDGIVMGGGVGLASHASHRVVTERSRVAMPEVRIGLVPDVGGTWLLARAPGSTGLHAALTVADLTAADAIAMGLADAQVPADALDDLLTTVAELGIEEGWTGSISNAAEPEAVAASAIHAQRDWIDPCYAAPTVPEIVARLQVRPEPAAQAAAAAITAGSPSSAVLTLAAIRAAGTDAVLEQSLNREFAVVTALLTGHDLAEGIRAQLIDKDRNPQWSPATLDAVGEQDVERTFRPADDEPFPGV
ncbi:enoyl-CoA hydratase/isomerase family protein [Nakamurella leprariae]|uniref:3-hydroxyisobutyryl-CoA hydrolase n=1 Tax=Nakamurella leprariae TaxID=2803911 RepID=A0A938YBU6_9ACTN|nr:enoyl-CoA hydratase/isomerase family protein [Nakamurella leprariae]MBM9469651.1 enoyl-CoA hydratase/isomerase family protein [Nakamurella leprariae]